MVKHPKSPTKIEVGFIVEGGSEACIVKSETFKSFLRKNNYELKDSSVINAKGKGNIHNNMNALLKSLKSKNKNIENLHSKRP